MARLSFKFSGFGFGVWNGERRRRIERIKIVYGAAEESEIRSAASFSSSPARLLALEFAIVVNGIPTFYHLYRMRRRRRHHFPFGTTHWESGTISFKVVLYEQDQGQGNFTLIDTQCVVERWRSMPCLIIIIF